MSHILCRAWQADMCTAYKYSCVGQLPLQAAENYVAGWHRLLPTGTKTECAIWHEPKPQAGRVEGYVLCTQTQLCVGTVNKVTVLSTRVTGNMQTVRCKGQSVRCKGVVLARLPHKRVAAAPLGGSILLSQGGECRTKQSSTMQPVWCVGFGRVCMCFGEEGACERGIACIYI